MTKLTFGATALALTIATQAMADQVISDDLIVSQGSATLLCLGSDCVDGETFSSTFDATLRLKANNNLIEFVDTSTSSFPDRDWKIQANSTSGGATGERFIIGDMTAGTEPFNIAGGAPTNAFFLSSSGDLGLGTILPGRDLHLVAGTTAGIRLEDVGTSPSIWDINAGSGEFNIRDVTHGTFPFVMRPSAPTYSINVVSSGNIGLGTFAPDGKLHTKGDGVQLVYFESDDGDAVQVRFRTDSENRRFLAVNNANEVKSQIVFGDDQIQFLGETVAQEWLRISSAGIVSSGPTCNPNPCDATFDPDAFTVPAIEERAAFMWENMHLPAVGPTEPGEPFNLTEKTAGILHELEVAHIYIGQLHERLTAQETEIARAREMESQVIAQAEQLNGQAALITSLMARLDAIEKR